MIMILAIYNISSINFIWIFEARCLVNTTICSIVKNLQILFKRGKRIIQSIIMC